MTVYKYQKLTPADIDTMVAHIRERDPADRFTLNEFARLGGVSTARLRRFMRTGNPAYELPQAVAVVLSLLTIPANLKRARLIADRMIISKENTDEPD